MVNLHQIPTQHNVAWTSAASGAVDDELRFELFGAARENSKPWSLMAIWMFPKIGVPKNGWFIKMVPNPMNKWMIWGVSQHPLFLETPIWTEGIMVTDKTNNLYILNFQLGLGSAFQEWNDDTKLTF